jgi:hypothetical protein
VSSVTPTFVAAGTAISVSEEVIPCLQKLFLMITEDLLDPPDLGPPKVAAVGQTERLQPKLSHAVLALDVYVSRLAAIARIEEDAIGTLL